MKHFAHLHVHTVYSMLDSTARVSDLIKKAKEDDMPAIAITDHGNMFGAKQFYDIAKRNGILPIIGCEVYIAPASRKNRNKNLKGNCVSYHLILLAKNKKGYQNLIKLSSLAWIDGFYYKPMIDRELLEKHHEGLIATSAYIGGEIQTAILENDIKNANATLLYYKQLFGDDFYLEVQRYPTNKNLPGYNIYEKQKTVNKALVELSKNYHVKLIAANDVYFTNAEDAKGHNVLFCNNHFIDVCKDYHKGVDNRCHIGYTGEEYFKTRVEMNLLFKDMPAAIENTMEVVNKIEDYTPDQKPVMPYFPVPGNFSDHDGYLTSLAYKGAGKRFRKLTNKIKERLEFELSIIKEHALSAYFLIINDIIQAVQKLDVFTGPGRGSVAGSLVAYCIGITNINPLKYGLLFERFIYLNKHYLPDIDIDIEETDKNKILRYLMDKYGEQHVALLITFAMMSAKDAIRVVACVIKLSEKKKNELIKLIPDYPWNTFEYAYARSKKLKELRKTGDQEIIRTLKLAETIEGSIMYRGINNPGILISRYKIWEHIPVCKSREKIPVSQYDDYTVESTGVLKIKLMGMKALTRIKQTLQNIRQSTGEIIDIDHIPVNDPQTFILLSNGDTEGVFHFENNDIKKKLRELMPDRFEDLIALYALYRPAAKKHISSFINRKHGKEKTGYALPVLKEHLGETYGLLIYQEQIMSIAKVMAGFTGEQADALRRAMGKRKKSDMDQLKVAFINGCKNNHYKTSDIQKVWKECDKGAQFAFSKAHSICYAYIAYMNAYLKAHYCDDFMRTIKEGK